MSAEFRIVIPARYASQRLPGKPLRKICDKPMIEWVYLAAKQSKASDVVIATDDARIVKVVEAFGGKACITDQSHVSGTDRILEVCELQGWSDDDVIVNLQGDEPLMPAVNMTQVAENLIACDADMATLHKVVDFDHANNPNQVKLVHDHQGYAMYFSRAPIPFDRNGVVRAYCGHIGIYAYRIGFIRTFNSLPVHALEKAEALEQLRAIANGFKIHTELAKALPGPGIDTENDLQQVEQIMKAVLK